MPKFDGNIESFDFVDDLTTHFENQGLQITEQIFELIQKAMQESLTIENGVIQSQNNSTVISRAKRLLIDYFESNAYQNYVNDMILGVGQIAESEEFMQKDLNKISFSQNFLKDNINPTAKMFMDFTRRKLGYDAFNNELIFKVEQQLLLSVNSGETLTQATTRQRYLTVGTKNVKGAFLKYAQHVTRDTYFGFDGTINQTIAEEFGLKNIRYVGSLAKDSRKQCKRWVKMQTLKYDELREEIALANQNGSGMRPGTRPDNFVTNRGGFKCRHRAIPVP